MCSDPESDSKAISLSRNVNVWHAATAVEDRGDFENFCEAVLPESERRDADRFRRMTTRNQHVVGRAMARTLLAKTLSSTICQRPDQIEFESGRHGKPRVVAPAGLLSRAFNIAHTDGLVLCGLADSEVELLGVDVESLRRRTSTDLAERYFSVPEVKFLRSRPVDQQKACFLRIWTLKEAYIKAIGTGLHTPLSDFAFENIESPHPQIRFLHRGLQDGRDWRFECFEPRSGFVASVAFAGPPEEGGSRVQWKPFESLLEGGE